MTWKGNILVQNTYTSYWDAHGLPYEMKLFSGRSDYEGFLEVRASVYDLYPSTPCYLSWCYLF